MIDLQTIQQCTQDIHPTTIMRIMSLETRHNPYTIGFRIVNAEKLL
jgi:hypothetical protein